ncbi:DUF3592 domain-containing protein [Pedobacter frigiditerrae]|uniref:DUF3592 domain-containing protein n=1 Tax=Pedobacter frigiditerrae TaxID=2530452 RepID=UPI00292F05E6|nr:DUF3592 domain-containing protein [Pedobacter frigiditerrae]
MEGLKLLVNELSNPYFIASIIGLILFLRGLMNIYKRQKYKNKAISVIGEVEDLIEESSFDSNVNVFYPLVSFDIMEGKTVAYKNHIGTNPSAYKKREKVKVLFLPESPKDFIIDDKKSYFFEYLILIIGLVVFFTCLIIFLIGIF